MARPVNLYEYRLFGLYDRSGQSLPSSITGKRGSADLISLNGPYGMVMPVGHKGINGRAVAPFYDLLKT